MRENQLFKIVIVKKLLHNCFEFRLDCKFLFPIFRWAIDRRAHSPEIETGWLLSNSRACNVCTACPRAHRSGNGTSRDQGDQDCHFHLSPPYSNYFGESLIWMLSAYHLFKASGRCGTSRSLRHSKSSTTHSKHSSNDSQMSHKSFQHGCKACLMTSADSTLSIQCPQRLHNCVNMNGPPSLHDLVLSVGRVWSYDMSLHRKWPYWIAAYCCHFVEQSGVSVVDKWSRWAGTRRVMTSHANGKSFYPLDSISTY